MRNRLLCIIGFIFGFLLASPVADAQPSRLVRVGWLTTAPHPFLDAFRQGLRELGWAEGQNLLGRAPLFQEVGHCV